MTVKRTSSFCLGFIAITLSSLLPACGDSAGKRGDQGPEGSPADTAQPADGQTPAATVGASAEQANTPGESVAEPVPADTGLIDDLEDGDDQILVIGGRAGFWHTFNDATPGGKQTPDPEGELTLEEGGPEGSAYCLHTTGSGFTEWGAGLGFDLNDQSAVSGGAAAKGPFDASGTAGITFKAKGNTYIRVAFPVQAVIPLEEGGTCLTSTVEGEDCYDVHGIGFSLTKDWKRFEVPFAKLTQEGWGKVTEFDLTTLLGVQFLIPPGVDFDVYIDEIAFY